MKEQNKDFYSLGVIIARTSNIHGNAKQAIEIGKAAIDNGKKVGIFLVSDGVWNALQNSGPLSEVLGDMVAQGVDLYISDEHARAAGLPRERVIDGAEYIENTYKMLVDSVMEKWDKVIIC